MLYNTWLHVVSCLHTMLLYMVKRKYANGRKHARQAHNASTNSSTNGGDASRVGIEKGGRYELY